MNFARHGIMTMAISLTVVSCDNSRHASSDPQWMTLEGNRIEVAHKVELARLKLDHQATEKAVPPTPPLDFSHLQARSDCLRAERDRLQTELAQAETAALNAHRAKVDAARASVIGKIYSVFQTVGGRSYEQARITSVTDDGVKLEHSSGIARLSPGDLEPTLKNFLGLDHQTGVETKELLRNQEAAYYRHIDRQLSAIAAQNEAAQTQKNEQSKMLARVSTAQPTIPSQVSVASSPLREPAKQTNFRVRPRRSSNYYYQYTGPRYYYPTYIRNSGSVNPANPIIVSPVPSTSSCW